MILHYHWTVFYSEQGWQNDNQRVFEQYSTSQQFNDFISDHDERWIENIIQHIEGNDVEWTENNAIWKRNLDCRGLWLLRYRV